VGSHEDLIDIYNVDTRKRVGICKGASSYITHVEWDVEGKLVMINSGAKEVLYFEMPRGSRVNIRADDVEKITWSTFTCVLGPSCEGIWQPCMDVTDINTSCLSGDRRTLATGDDFGLVKLFDYPCVGKFAKFKKYNGHSSHVTCVRWSAGDVKLFSVGGMDTALIIWNNLAGGGGGEVVSVMSGNKAASGLNVSISMSAQNELAQRNTRKGESEDSETDSEDEGYDSDVKREHIIDYTKNIFTSEIKRPSEELVKELQDKVTDSNKE
jgi:microtubule-associated protein-like 6